MRKGEKETRGSNKEAKYRHRDKHEWMETQTFAKFCEPNQIYQLYKLRMKIASNKINNKTIGTPSVIFLSTFPFCAIFFRVCMSVNVCARVLHNNYQERLYHLNNTNISIAKRSCSYHHKKNNDNNNNKK